MELLFIFFVLGMMVVGFISGVNQRRRINEVYARLAKHYGGAVYEAGMFGRPHIEYTHDDAKVKIDIYSTGGKHPTYYTQVHFQGLHPSARCEVYPEKMWSRIGKLIGMEDIVIGSPNFDDQYIIKGDDPAKITALLTPSVQKQINRLRQLLGNNNIYVSFSRHKLLIKKLSYIRDYATLLRFSQLAAKLYDLTIAIPEGAITIVSQSEPMESEAICQICGEPITQQRVLCRRCKTPHHLDCWEYYGACSTYGCQESRHIQRGIKPRR